MNACWQCEPADAFAWREWDGEIVVYVRRTGDTHLLGAEASALFVTMLARPALSGSVHFWLRALIDDGQLAAPSGSPADEEAVGADQLLRGLEHIGVVRSLS